MTTAYGPRSTTPEWASSASDAELAARVRGGERDAFGELWSRHAAAAHAVASQFRSIADPEDIAQEVSRRIFDVLLRGNGPTGDFRPYINQTVRNTAVSLARRPAPEPVGDAFDFAEENLGEEIPDYADSAVERIITIRAFKALNARWQEVLWYIAVEGMTSEEAALRMGLSANATAALANRAREGLRVEWLRAHTADETLPAECRWVVDRLPSLERGTITARHRKRVEKHTAQCLHCARVAAELNDLATRLPLVVLPLLVAGADILRLNLHTLLSVKLSQSAIAASAAALASSGAAASGAAAALSTTVAAATVGTQGATAVTAGAGAQGGQVAAGSLATTSIGKGLVAAKLATQGWWAVGGVAAALAVATALALVVAPSPEPSAADVAGPGQFPRDAVVLPTPAGASAAPHTNASAPAKATEAAASGAPSVGPNARNSASAPPVAAGGTGANAGTSGTGGGAGTGGEAAGGNGGKAGTGNGKGAEAPAAPDPMTVPAVSNAPASGQLTWVNDLTMSGTGHPGWTVQVISNGSVIGSTTVGADGTWSYTPTVTSSSPMNMSVRQTDGTRTSSNQKVGNYTFKVPGIGSVSSSDAGVVGGTHRNSVLVAATGDAVVRATLNGSTQSGSAPSVLTFPSVPDGTYTLTVVYVDTATGRVSAPVTQTVTLP